MLEFITFIPALELLLVNLIIINRCCSRKYSLLKTFSILIIFSGALFTFFIYLLINFLSMETALSACSDLFF